MSKMIASVDAASLRMILDLALRHNLMGMSTITDAQREAFYQCANGVVTAKVEVFDRPASPKKDMATFVGLSEWAGEKINLIKLFREYCNSREHLDNPVIDPMTRLPLESGLRACKTFSEMREVEIPLELGRAILNLQGKYPGICLVRFPPGYTKLGYPTGFNPMEPAPRW